MSYQGSLTDEQQEQIRALIREGLAVRAIPEVVGVPYGQVRGFAEKVSPYQPFNVRVWDLETTDLNTFFGILIVASFLDMADGQIQTKTFHDFPSDHEPHQRRVGGGEGNGVVALDVGPDRRVGHPDRPQHPGVRHVVLARPVGEPGHRAGDPETYAL